MSSKYSLQQNILKTNNADYNNEEEKRKKEEQFLHIPMYDLLMEEKIGSGGFADVYRGTWLSRDQQVAIKLVRINPVPDSVKQDFLNELSIMYRIRYDHVLTVFGACIESNYCALITEYMPLRSLFDVLQKKEPILTWSDRWMIALQMVKSINYLHMLQPPILHRDIKSMNFLLAEGKDGFIVKVGDFGLSEIKNKSLKQCRIPPTESIGTLQWKAPELLELGEYTVKSDIYSLGIVFWELATGCIPFDDVNEESVIRTSVLAGERLEIPQNVPGEFCSIIISSWSHNPDQRPTCSELIKIIKKVILSTVALAAPPLPKKQASVKQRLLRSVLLEIAIATGPDDHRAVVLESFKHDIRHLGRPANGTLFS
ncbi:unnamed protein product, partial [Didymodactylos carnosus]